MKRSVINVFIILLTFLIMTGGSGAVYTEKKQEKIKVNSASIGLTVSEPVFCNIPEEISNDSKIDFYVKVENTGAVPVYLSENISCNISEQLNSAEVLIEKVEDEPGLETLSSDRMLESKETVDIFYRISFAGIREITKDSINLDGSIEYTVSTSPDGGSGFVSEIRRINLSLRDLKLYQDNTVDAVIEERTMKKPNGETMEVTNEETMEESNGKTVEGIKEETMEVTNGETMEVTNGETMEVTNGETMEVTNGETMEVTNGETMEVTNGETMEVTNGETMEVTNGETMEVTNGEIMEEPNGETMEELNGETMEESNGEPVEGIMEETMEDNIDEALDSVESVIESNLFKTLEELINNASEIEEYDMD
jgi:hypothetical protein